MRCSCPGSKYVVSKVPVYCWDICEASLSVDTKTLLTTSLSCDRCLSGWFIFSLSVYLWNPHISFCLKSPGRRWLEWFIGTYMICMQHNLPTGPQWTWGNRGTACAKWHWNSQETRGAFLVRSTVPPDPYVYLMHHFYSGQSSNLISAGPFQLPTLNLWLCMGSRESVCAL